MLGVRQKRPADVLDYDIEFEDWLTDDDTITTVASDVSPAGGLVVDSVQIVGTSIKVWVSGGVLNTTYDVSITVSTQGGRVKEECFKVRVRDC